MPEPAPRKAVYTIVKKNDGTSIWIRVGWAHTNPDGSLDIDLDALPVNGKLQVRELEPRDCGSGNVDTR